MADIDVAKIPTMTTRNAESLISDSGITRFKMTAPLWLVFDEREDPYWKFPEGLHLEKFNPFLKIEATVDADSATYFKDRGLWRLDGQVDISNVAGERFLTQQLYWDQQQHMVYTDSFVSITQPNRQLEGYGFTSNEQMTKYSVRRVSGIFPASTFKRNKPTP